MGDSFNRAVDKLPKKLTHLYCGNAFNHSVNTLPSNLKYLNLGDAFATNCDTLPSSLETLIVQDTSFFQKLPETLRSIDGLLSIFGYCVTSFTGLADITNEYPSNLTLLSFTDQFDKPLYPNCVPPTITILRLGEQFNSAIKWLPPNLKCLIFGEHFNQALPELPGTIMELYFGYNSVFDQPLNGKLPANLKSLSLLSVYSHRITLWPALGTRLGLVRCLCKLF